MDMGNNHSMDTPPGTAHLSSMKILTKRERISGLHIDTKVETVRVTENPQNEETSKRPIENSVTLIEALDLGTSIAYHALAKDMARSAVLKPPVSADKPKFPKLSPKLSPLKFVRSITQSIRRANSSARKTFFQRKSPTGTYHAHVIGTDTVAEDLVGTEAVSAEAIFIEAVYKETASTEAFTTLDPKTQTVGTDCIATEVFDTTVTTTETLDTNIFSSNAVAQDITPAELVSQYHSYSANNQIEFSTASKATAPYHRPGNWQRHIPTAQDLHFTLNTNAKPVATHRQPEHLQCRRPPHVEAGSIADLYIRRELPGGAEYDHPLHNEEETEEEVYEDQVYDGDNLLQLFAAENSRLSASNSASSSSGTADDELLPGIAYRPYETSAVDDVLLPMIAYDPKEAAKPRSPVASATRAAHFSNPEVIYFSSDDLLRSDSSHNPNDTAELSITTATYPESHQQQAYHTGEGHFEHHQENHQRASASPVGRDFASFDPDPPLQPRIYTYNPSQECGASIYYAASIGSRNSKSSVEAPARDPNLPLLVDIKMLRCPTDVLGLGVTIGEAVHEHEEPEHRRHGANGHPYDDDEDNSISSTHNFIPLHSPSPVTTFDVSTRSRFVARETFVLPPSGAYVSSDEETYVEEMLTSGEETADEQMEDEQMEDEQMAVKRDQDEDVVAAALDEEVIRWYRSGRYGPHMRNYLMNGEF